LKIACERDLVARRAVQGRKRIHIGTVAEKYFSVSTADTQFARTVEDYQVEQGAACALVFTGHKGKRYLLSERILVADDNIIRREHGQGNPHPDPAPPPKSSVTHPRNSRRDHSLSPSAIGYQHSLPVMVG
jgi:hypothetical protein